jgi:hypothetical protein
MGTRLFSLLENLREVFFIWANLDGDAFELESLLPFFHLSNLRTLYLSGVRAAESVTARWSRHLMIYEDKDYIGISPVK